ncbi:MAG TPA: MlaD family protein [Solirubrobacteraceae bacterium]|nr:MlaD family protein [Solirubrobacteraceae bacterium]
MRRTGSSVLANPVLVGAVTVLVTTVAVFLAYNANNGLPFVPTTTLKVQTPNGSQLVRGNEVRSGGYRVGVISDIQPVQMMDGGVGAELTLKLDKAIGDIPRDSTVEIRPRSALGLKYVDLTEGSSDEAFDDGETMPAAQTRTAIDLDRVFEMFDEPTRRASQVNLQGFGDALTGRGEALGRTIHELPRTLRHLEPVMRTLSARETQLEDFFAELGDAARTVRPVSKTQARLFTTMADTFEALGRDEQALKDFIAKSPPTLDVSTDSLRVQRPFLANFADFSEALQPATRELRAALPTINRAVGRGIGVQRRFAGTNRELRRTMRALRELVQPPQTGVAVRALTATVTTLNPQIRFYGPFQTVCNNFNYFFTYLAEHFSERDAVGQAQRALLNSAGRQKNSLASMGAYLPANGEDVQEGNAQHLHGPGYAAAVMPDGRADCEVGQRGYLERLARFVPREYRVHGDARSPGAQGPTFRGRERVPEGQTFSHLPETGAYKDIPANELGER